MMAMVVTGKPARGPSAMNREWAGRKPSATQRREEKRSKENCMDTLQDVSINIYVHTPHIYTYLCKCKVCSHTYIYICMLYTYMICIHICMHVNIYMNLYI